GVEMDAIFARVGVKMRERVFRRGCGRFALNIDGEHVTHRRLREKFLLGWIEALNAEEIDVRLADKRRLAPEANEFRGAFADDACDDHTVNTAGRSSCGSI